MSVNTIDVEIRSLFGFRSRLSRNVAFRSLFGRLSVVAMSDTVPEEIDTDASSSGSRKRKNGAEPEDEEGRYQKNVAKHFECDRCGRARTGSGPWRQVFITPSARQNWDKCSQCRKYANDEYAFTAWWCEQCYDAFVLFANRYDR